MYRVWWWDTSFTEFITTSNLRHTIRWRLKATRIRSIQIIIRREAILRVSTRKIARCKSTLTANKKHRKEQNKRTKGINRGSRHHAIRARIRAAPQIGPRAQTHYRYTYTYKEKTHIHTHGVLTTDTTLRGISRSDLAAFRPAARARHLASLPRVRKARRISSRLHERKSRREQAANPAPLFLHGRKRVYMYIYTVTGALIYTHRRIGSNRPPTAFAFTTVSLAHVISALLYTRVTYRSETNSRSLYHRYSPPRALHADAQGVPGKRFLSRRRPTPFDREFCRDDAIRRARTARNSGGIGKKLGKRQRAAEISRPLWLRTLASARPESWSKSEFKSTRGKG